MKNKITYCLGLCIMLLGSPFTSQAQITFDRVYSSFYDQSAFDVIQTSDGGYLVASMTTNDIMDDMDMYIMKLNNVGDTLWSRKFGGALPDFPYSILETADGNYFAMGYSQSFGGGDYDIYLVKFNPSGGIIWSKTYGGWGNDQGREIIPTSDGNYMIVGYSSSQNFSNYDACLIKIDPAGTKIWEKYYGGAGASDYGNSVKQCQDGGYIMVGLTFSYGTGGDIYMVRTNSTGDTTWTKNFGGAQSQEAMYVLANSDGTFTFCVRDSSNAGFGDVDVRVVKTEANGNINWSKSFGGDKKDTDKMIQATSDGGYIIAGHSRSFGWVNPDMWLIKLNSDGDSLWTRNYGGTDHEHCQGIRQTSDDGFIAVGHTESFSSTNEIMVLKLNALGKLGPLSADEIPGDNTLSVYPNPSNGIVNINFEKESFSSFRISNVLGQVIYSEVIDPLKKDNKKAIDLHHKEPGIYFITMESEAGAITKKIVLR